jgi:BirA family biotin operon repressor/biotin-[acetyl-CoA-carboxylase] ligase
MSFFPALDETAIRQQLSPASSAALQRLSLLEQTPSSNALLLQMPAEERHAHAVLADHQTAGKGRRGRSWQSPPGSNIYLSLGWNFDSVPADLSCLPLAMGVAVVRGLERKGVPELGLKWPNDIQAGGKKLGGILVESKPRAHGGVSVVAGVGINVRMSAESVLAQAIDQPWTAVCDLQDAAQDEGLRDHLAGAVLDQWLLCMSRYAENGFHAYDEDWLRLDVLKNQLVTVTAAGSKVHGRALGIDELGNLQVAEHFDNDKQKLHRFSSGEVSVRLDT